MALEEECRQSVDHLRASLIDLYASVGANPDSPQDVAREFRLSNTLAWNIAKLMRHADGFDAIPHVPGTTAIERVIRATEKHGAPPAAVGRVRDAVRAFERMIEVHVGDRHTLDTIIDGMGSDGDGLMQSRKKSYLGDRGLYGIEAEVNLGCHVLAPSRDNPDTLDTASVRGYVGIRRLRPNVRRAIFLGRTWYDEEDKQQHGTIAPLINGAPDFFLHEFNSADLPVMGVAPDKDSFDAYVVPGDIGNRGAFSCFLGYRTSGAARYREEAGDGGEFAISTNIPSRRMIFDLIIHRDIECMLKTKNTVYAQTLTRSGLQYTWELAEPLPIRCKPFDLIGSPPAVGTSNIPRYNEAVNLVYTQLGWNPSDFRGSRLEIEYPPLSSFTSRRFDLAARPE